MEEARHRRPAATGSAAAACVAALLCLVPGCQFKLSGAAGPIDDPDAGADPVPDAEPPPPPIDAAIPSPDAPPPVDSAHLLLTEVKTQPTAAEFIEVFNPLLVEIPLEDYYLSDDPLYARLPEHEPGDEVAVGTQDGIVRFPEGAVLMPGQVIVIAMNEQGFRAAFGDQAPDYAVVAAGEPTATPMVIVADDGTAMQFTDTGEPIILFRWDELNDLVTDVDIVVIGNNAPAPGTDNGLPDKSAIVVDGPDLDRRARPYAPDLATMTSMSFRSTGSYKRIAREGDHETSGEGNGIAGHDETSEQTLDTWGQTDTAPTPGEVPSELGN